MRSEALRERRNDVPRSATDEEMLYLLVCFFRGGVEGTFAGNSYWLAKRGTLLESSDGTLLLLLLTTGGGVEGRV